MNENGVDTTTVEETGGFIDDMGVDMSEYTTGGGEDQPAEPETVADAPAGEAEPDSAAEEQPAGEQSATGGDGALDGVKIPVKWLDRQRDLTVAEATAYAQKGMDYDRIRGKLDEANTELETLRQFRAENGESIEFLQQLAQDSNMSLSDMIDEIKAGQLMKKENISRDVAVERVKRQNVERRLSAKNTEQQQQTAAAARRKADIAAFLSKFPGVTGTDIPKEVWDRVNSGETLVSAYEAHMTAKKDAEKDRKIADLQRELAALKQNAANRQRSTGSQRTGGQEANRDTFLDALLADD